MLMNQTSTNVLNLMHQTHVLQGTQINLMHLLSQKTQKVYTSIQHICTLSQAANPLHNLKLLHFRLSLHTHHQLLDHPSTHPCHPLVDQDSSLCHGIVSVLRREERTK